MNSTLILSFRLSTGGLIISFVVIVWSALLGSDKIEYEDYNFLNPPKPTLPYIVLADGYVLECHVARPPMACYPVDVSTSLCTHVCKARLEA